MSQESPLSKYVLKQTLQTAIFGSVFLAQIRATEEYVVVKRSSKKLFEATQSRSLECPLNERAIYQQILRDSSNHPGRVNIVKALGFEVDEQHHWLVLEHCQRGDLLDHCEGLEPHRAKHFFRQMVQGVAYLHSLGIAHRDLSPENVFITKDDVCKIGDFGQAIRWEQAKELSVLRAGKIGYMSPEALAGAPVDAMAGDVFSLGVCLFIMLTGSPPWQEASSDDSSFYHVRRGLLSKIVHVWNFASRVPPLAVHLLNGMFRPQAKRLSLHEVISHPFLAKECLPSISKDSSSHQETNNVVHVHVKALACR
jgi:calcium-dependent protein kinase